MSTYLRLAEKIYNEVGKDKRFMQVIEEDFNKLMTLIRQNVKGTELRLKCQSLDFEMVRMCSDRSKIHVDLTLIPQISQKQEFILWLAQFIEKITNAPKKEFPPLARPVESLPQLNENYYETNDKSSGALEKYFSKHSQPIKIEAKKRSKYMSLSRTDMD